MTFFAVIDTNVLVSALLSNKSDSATMKVLNYILDGTVTPLYSPQTMAEYCDVLARPKFDFAPNLIAYVLGAIGKFGVLVNPESCGAVLPDPKDLPFYDLAVSYDNFVFLVTGNLKHFTNEKFVVTPAEFIEIIEKGRDIAS